MRRDYVGDCLASLGQSDPRALAARHMSNTIVDEFEQSGPGPCSVAFKTGNQFR